MTLIFHLCKWLFSHTNIILITYRIHIINNLKPKTSSQRRHTLVHTILTATFMDTRTSTQSSTILIQKTNLTFKKDKIILVFYIRNDLSNEIMGCRLGK